MANLCCCALQDIFPQRAHECWQTLADLALATLKTEEKCISLFVSNPRSSFRWGQLILPLLENLSCRSIINLSAKVVLLVTIAPSNVENGYSPARLAQNSSICQPWRCKCLTLRPCCTTCALIKIVNSGRIGLARKHSLGVVADNTSPYNCSWSCIRAIATAELHEGDDKLHLRFNLCTNLKFWGIGLDQNGQDKLDKAKELRNRV